MSRALVVVVTLFLASVSCSCAPSRTFPKKAANFTVLTTKHIHKERPHTLFRPEIHKRRCFSLLAASLEMSDPVFEEIVQDALAEFPEANAIVLARLEDEGRCVTLTGFAARID